MKKQKKERKPLSIPVFLAVYVAVIAACIAIDQISKHYVEIAVANYAVEHNSRNIPILGNWLTLTWTTNTGATGSMFSGLAWRNWLFFAMTLIGLPVFGYLLWRSRTRSVWGQVAFAFIIGGTLGNAIDRVRFAEDGFFTGAVRDFIQVEGFFGIFNGADSFLVVGVILALLAIVFLDPDSLLFSFLKERKAKQEQGEDGEKENTKVNTEHTAEQSHEEDRTDV
ncbi:MAG: signal peptidase II [Clostridiales bacterium]|nr:signal peptidase II [Clostridiales bacterium]